jgi:hypothetical protein
MLYNAVDFSLWSVNVFMKGKLLRVRTALSPPSLHQEGTVCPEKCLATKKVVGLVEEL